MSIVYSEYDRETGLKTKVHDVDGKITIQKEWDSELFKREAHARRVESEGKRWGELKHVGFIPNAELSVMLRQDGRIDTKRVRKYLKENPDLVTFSKYLK